MGIGMMVGQEFVVSEVVPHKGAMVLLDKILSVSEEELTAQVTITATTLFLNEKNYVPAWIGIEYMAQAVAAWAGVQRKKVGNDAKIGFLLGTRKYTCYGSKFFLDDVLNIHITRKYQESELAVFDCKISTNELLATAALNVYQPK